VGKFIGLVAARSHSLRDAAVYVKMFFEVSNKNKGLGFLVEEGL